MLFSLKSHIIIQTFFPHIASNLLFIPGGVENVQPVDTSRWVARCFLAAVLLHGIYMMRVKTSPNRVGPAHGSNSSIVVLFTMTWHCFSPSRSIHQPSEWSQIAVGMTFVFSLSCALGRSVHVLIACRTALSVMKLFCSTQLHCRAFHVTVLFIWLTLNPLFTNKNTRHWFEDILVVETMGLTPKSWAVLRQIELLATFFLFVSLPSMLQSILTKLNVLSVLLNVQLITCLQNSRVPTKYVLLIKINR